MDLLVEHEHSSRELRYLFSLDRATFTTSLIPFYFIFGALTDPDTTATPWQLAWFFILHLLSCTIFVDMGSQARITYVFVLRDLEGFKEYNQGSLGYVTLVLYLRAVYRSTSTISSLAGF